MASVDVTVRGAGVFGLSVAWACAARGARVRVIDPFGVGAGASGGLVGALAPHVPEAWNALKQFQFESLLMAGGWWAAVAAAGGVDPGYARTGRVQPLADAAAVAAAQARAAGAAAHWGGLAAWRVEAAAGPFAPVSATGLVVRDTLTARLSPRGAGRALVAAVRARGGEVVAEGADAGAVVHATGVAGLEALGEALGRKVGGGVKGQAALLRLDAKDFPQVYAAGLHVVPHADGRVAVGSTSENRWTVEGVDAQVEDLIARARAVVPALEGAEVIERWAGVRPRAVTRQPLLGAWPGRAGQFVANGGFKIGFGLAPKVAEVMADLVLEARDGVPEGMRLV
jgi:glycine/D-amino acid oxidase-like deaminating enzyme